MTISMYLYLTHEYQSVDLLDNFQSYNSLRMNICTRRWKQMHDLLDAGLLKKRQMNAINYRERWKEVSSQSCLLIDLVVPWTLSSSEKFTQKKNRKKSFITFFISLWYFTSIDHIRTSVQLPNYGRIINEWEKTRLKNKILSSRTWRSNFDQYLNQFLFFGEKIHLL
jgi:hypothetical protein